MITWNSTTSLTLSWLASQDTGSGLKQYKVYKNDVFLANVAAGTTTYTDNAVSAGTTYSYVVRAEDYAGNLSTGCTPVSTQDGTPPPCPGNLQATAVSNTSITLSWLPVTDTGSGLRQYKVYRNDVLLSNVAAGTTTYTDSTVSVGVTYAYSVLAEDWAGNLSAGCGSIIVTAANGAGNCGDALTGIVTVTSSPSSTVQNPSIAWDGSAYGIAWRDDRNGNGEIYFARVASDGAVIVPARRITNATAASDHPSLVWTGSEYGLAWDDFRDGRFQIYFNRLAADGTPQDTDSTPFPHASSRERTPSLVWAGAGDALSWEDDRDALGGGGEVYFGRLDVAGDPVGSCLRVSTNDGLGSRTPSLAWTGTEYGIAWSDLRNTYEEIYFGRVSSTGSRIGGDVWISSNSNTYGCTSPSLAWTGSHFGVAWYDYTVGTPRDVYFAAISSDGVKIGSDIQVTNASSMSYFPILVWTGSEFYLAWRESLSNSDWIEGISLDANGNPKGGIRQYVSIGTSRWDWPALAKGERGIGLAFSADLISDEIRFIGLGCGAPDTTPPSCPSSPAETARTLTSVTLGWGPSVDPDSDLGGYRIYRDGSVVGVTANTTWTDTSFNPSAGYVYVVTATNAAGFESAACASVDTADHVQPSCVGGLMATVIAGNVTLNWVQAWDDKSGVKEYHVYRNGTLRGTIPFGTNTFSEAVAPGSTYNYVVETADYAGNTNSGCTTCSVWVYGGALLLFMTKNADKLNANLDWNDVGLTEYVVYRSLSPQIDQEIKRVSLSETTDPVLQDGQRLWFYIIQQRE